MRYLKLAQGLTGLVGTIFPVYSLGLYLRVPAVRQLWVWPESPALGLAFVGSWLAGLAAPLIWIGLAGHLPALRGGALAGVVAYGGSAFLLWVRHSLPGKERFLPFAVVCVLIALFAVIVLIWSARLSTPDDRRSPPVIRWTFLLFSAILLPVGLGMVMGNSRIFPAELLPDMTRLYGWFFLGSFVYYFFGFLKPSWLNSTGHMLSFLVYDLLLIPPFAQYWQVVPADFRWNLFMYLMVLVASMFFCIFFLFMNPRTRLFRTASSFSANV
ncbi:MAG TPA: hypothetical protein VMN99_02020 [Anaerolineales bacterium]|nr:hypothetical protein [Anaerolineales bacterium]